MTRANSRVKVEDQAAYRVALKQRTTCSAPNPALTASTLLNSLDRFRGNYNLQAMAKRCLVLALLGLRTSSARLPWWKNKCLCSQHAGRFTVCPAKSSSIAPTNKRRITPSGIGINSYVSRATEDSKLPQISTRSVLDRASFSLMSNPVCLPSIYIRMTRIQSSAQRATTDASLIRR